MTFFLIEFLYTTCGDKMIIYVDLVFFLNIILDFILLVSVSITLTRNAKVGRIILGSIMGGGSTLILFINMNSYILFILKIILGIVMCIVTFGFKSMKFTFNNFFYLCTISFSVSGVLYLLKDTGFYNYFVIILGFILVCIIFVKQKKMMKSNYSDYYKVKIVFNDKELNLIGYLDTGNKLYDNYKHRPVIIIDKKIDYSLNEVIYVSYMVLNKESVIKCLKPKKVIVNNKEFHNYLVGLSNKKIKIDGINCILHSEMKGKL